MIHAFFPIISSPSWLLGLASTKSLFWTECWNTLKGPENLSHLRSWNTCPCMHSTVACLHALCILSPCVLGEWPAGTDQTVWYYFAQEVGPHHRLTTYGITWKLIVHARMMVWTDRACQDDGVCKVHFSFPLTFQEYLNIRCMVALRR